MNGDQRFDFIVLRVKPGVDPAAAQSGLVTHVGAKPEKAQVLLKHLAEKGAVAIEKATTATRCEELKAKWEAAGLEVTAKEVLAIVDEPAGGAKPGFKCPSCGQVQEPPPNDQCKKCGVFAQKFLEQQKKNELYRREREKIEAAASFRNKKDADEARKRKEEAELEAMRSRIKDELGLNKPEGRFDWLGSTPGAKLGVIVTVTAGLAVMGWLVRSIYVPTGPSQELLARQQAAMQKQNSEAMQKMVGQLLVGSKKFAQDSGAAAQFSQALFANGERDADLVERLDAAQAGNREMMKTGAIAPDPERAASLAAAAKDFADSGGSIENAERALSAAMQTAHSIKDGQQRNDAVSAVASAQFEMYVNDAKGKAAAGDWRAADRSFAKALSAASQITSRAESIAARGRIAKARADTGDYGVATLLFIDAMKTAEEIADPRERALVVADLAKTMAETGNELDGAAGRAFERAREIAATLKTEAERVELADAILQRRVEAACNVAGGLLSADATAASATPLLESAAKDVEQLTDPLAQMKALTMIARITAEFQAPSPANDALLARINKLPETVPELRRELAAAMAARAQAAVLGASAKYRAGKGDKAQAKQTFLAALRASNAITTKSVDPALRREIARQRSESLGELARYMQAAGDKQAAASVFKLALESAGPAEATKVISLMVSPRTVALF